MMSPLEDHTYATTLITKPASWRFYRCAQCPYRSKYKEIINKHRKNHNATRYYHKHFPCARNFNRSFECKNCLFSTNIWMIYQRHLKQEKQPNRRPKLPFRSVVKHCRFCGFSTHSALINLAHRMKCTKRINPPRRIGWLSCPKCRFATLIKDELKWHFRNSHFTKNKRKMLHLCKQCDFQADTAMNLRKHMLMTHEDSDEEPTIPKTMTAPVSEVPSKQLVPLKPYKNCEGTEKLTYNHVVKEATAKSDTNKVAIKAETLDGIKQEKHDDCDGDTLLIPTYSMKPNSEWKFCGSCKYQTEHLEELKVHILEMHQVKETTFHCHFCTFQCNSEEERVKHMKCQHSYRNKQFNRHTQCSKCPVNCENFRLLQLHMLHYHKDTSTLQYQCEHCPYKTSLEHAFISHNRQKHYVTIIPEVNTKQDDSDKGYKCPECPFETTFLIAIKNHMKYKHEIEMVKKKPTIFKCPVCVFNTTSAEEKQEHMREYHNNAHELDVDDCDDHNKCQVCDYNTTNRHRYLKHMFSDHDAMIEKRFQCPKCKYKTDYKKSIMKHMKDEHADDSIGEKKCYKCQMCPFETEHRHAFTNHNYHKHGIKIEKEIWKCDLCSFQTNRKTTLDKHIFFKHTLPDTKVECDFCRYRPTDQSDLMLHFKRKHNFYQCDLCKYEGYGVEGYKEHLLQEHIDLDCIKCDLCDFETNDRLCLKDHIIDKHIKTVYIYRYKCDLCMFNTTELSDFQEHTLNMHKLPERLFKCQLCTFETRDKNVLKEHILGQHFGLD